jgi:hypothetical protein
VICGVFVILLGIGYVVFREQLVRSNVKANRRLIRITTPGRAIAYGLLTIAIGIIFVTFGVTHAFG